MILDLPKIGLTRFDDSLTEEQFNAELERLSKKYEFEIPRSQLTTGEMASRAFTRGTKRLGSTFGDIIPAMGAKALGFEEYAQKQLEEAKATEEEIAKYYAPQYPEMKAVKGISDVPGFFLETIVEQIPNIATSLVPGVGAGAIAARTGLTSLGKSLAVQGAEKGLAGRELAEFVAQGMTQGAATRQAVGQGAGVFLGSYAQNAPEIFQNIYQETGQMDVGASLLFGAGSAALDSVLPAQLAKSLTGPVKAGIVEKVLEKSGMDKGLLRSITAGTLKGMGAEGLTEGAQEAISIYAENFVGNNPQIFDSADWNRIMESSVRGAVAGSAFGGAGGVGSRVQEKRAEFAEQQAKLAEQQRQELARQVQEANLTIDEYNALQKQGMLPGMELGAYTTRLIEPKAKEEAQKELKGKQLSLFDEQGLPTKTAESARIKGDKAEANRLRQLQQKEAAELKASQAKLKKFLAAKQGELNLTEAPPIAGVAVEGQPDLFGAPPAAPITPVAEPSVISKPAKLTPKEVGTTVNDDVFNALGIGRTALIRTNDSVRGKDISNPADAAEVRRVLEAYADRKNLSTNIRQKVEEYLSRPEFQQEVISEPISESAGPVGGAVQPSLPSDQQQPTFTSTPELIEGPVQGGMATAGPAPVPVIGGEEGVSRPLSKRQQNDLKKAQERLQPAIDEERKFIIDTDKRILNFIRTGMADIKGLRKTDAFKLMRIAPLTQEYVRLKEVTEQIADAKQRKKNLRQMELIRNALAQSSPEAVKLAENQNSNTIGDFTTRVNEMARAELAIEQEARAAAPQVTQEQITEQERIDAQELQDEALAAQMAEDFVNSNVAKAIQRNELGNALDALIKDEKNPEVKKILQKIKGMGLKTTIRVGKIQPKPGKMNIYDFAEFDPATNTITYDPTYLNKNTTIHEIVHAAISKILLNPSHPLTKELTKLYESVYNQLGSSYGALDIHEFAAELISNPEFQATLKAIKAPRGGNMFQRMMQVLAEFFGFRKGTSAYDKGLRTISDIIDLSGDVEANNADKMFHGIGPSTTNSFNKGVSGIAKQMPLLAGRTLEETKNYLATIKDFGALKTAMGLLRLDNLNTLYKTELPSIQPLLDALEQRNGLQAAEISRINNNYKKFAAAVKANPKAAERMNEMAIEARLKQVDPAYPNFKPTAANAADYRKLRSVYTNLPKDLQETYVEIRNEYKTAFNAYKKFLLQSNQLSASLRNKIKLEFEAIEGLLSYVPFLRRGDFWIDYADPVSGERVATAFVSTREREKFIKEQLSPGTPVKRYMRLEEMQYNRETLPPTSFVHNVIKELRANGASEDMVNSVYQSYLALMPAESISKRLMKSENVQGMEKDIVRGYSETMPKWARKLADSEFAPKIDQAVSKILIEAKNSGRDDVNAAASNIKDQLPFFHNPTYGKLVSGATTFSYFEYIAGNISSALIQLTTLPMFGWPVLGGKFGFDSAFSAMMNGSKVTTNYLTSKFKGGNPIVPPQYSALFKVLNEHGQLEHTMAREVLEARRMTTQDYIGLKAKVMDILSYPINAAETLNRGAIAIAAYDLARKGNPALNVKPMNEEQAIRYALDTVKDINTSAMAATAPKWMQHPIGRVFFTFKSFVWNSAFIVARAFHQAVKGESQEVRRIARRQLLGIYGMAGAFAGVKGLPFYGMFSTMAQMLEALFGDDDEPIDINEEMRDFFGELLYKGPTNFFTNLELSTRTGVAQDLIFRDDPRGVAEHGYAITAMKSMFGPAGSYVFNIERSIKAMDEGNVLRGIEGLVPSFVRNGMKGARYMTEGALTLKGDPVEEDIGAYNSVMQIIGFSPASLSSTYEKTSAAKGYDKEIAARRQRLLNKYDMARTAGDSDLMAEAREEIEAFNARRTNPKDRITGDTLSRSQKARQAAEKNMINGVTFNRNRKAEIEEKFFSDEED